MQPGEKRTGQSPVLGPSDPWRRSRRQGEPAGEPAGCQAMQVRSVVRELPSPVVCWRPVREVRTELPLGVAPRGWRLVQARPLWEVGK